MICSNPVVLTSGAVACGKCYSCGVRRKKEIVARVQLEGMSYDKKAFVTLTYDDENLPLVGFTKVENSAENKVVYEEYPEHPVGTGSLRPSDFSGFIKRLRKEWPTPFRFFGVGEYGDKSGRPHYHAILFGFPPCNFGSTRNRLSYCCSVCDLVEQKWAKGRIEVAQANSNTMAYTAGYAAKKLTSAGDPRLFIGTGSDDARLYKHPEFSRMSRRPGIGASAAASIGAGLERFRETLPNGDAPESIQIGEKKYPLDRFMRDKIRNAMGLPAGATEQAQIAQSIKLQEMQAEADQAGLPLQKYLRQKGQAKEKAMKSRYDARKRQTL